MLCPTYICVQNNALETNEICVPYKSLSTTVIAHVNTTKAWHKEAHADVLAHVAKRAARPAGGGDSSSAGGEGSGAKQGATTAHSRKSKWACNRLLLFMVIANQPFSVNTMYYS